MTLARADGDRLILPRAVTLPDVCMKCGASDRAIVRTARPFWHLAPWAYALVLLGPLGALGMLALTKTAALSVPTCAACDARWKIAAQVRSVMSAVAALATIASVFWPLASPGKASVVGAVVVTLAALALLVGAYVATAPRVVRARAIDATHVTLAGVHPTAIDAACRTATHGPELPARANTRVAARLLVAHVLAYTLAFSAAVAGIPASVRALPPVMIDAPADVVASAVLRQLLWPCAGIWVLVHVLVLPWALARDPSRVRVSRALFFVAVSALFLATAGIGGVMWWQLVYPAPR